MGHIRADVKLWSGDLAGLLWLASKLEGVLSGAKKFLAAPVARADHPMGRDRQSKGALWCECFVAQGDMFLTVSP